MPARSRQASSFSRVDRLCPALQLSAWLAPASRRVIGQTNGKRRRRQSQKYFFWPKLSGSVERLSVEGVNAIMAPPDIDGGKDETNLDQVQDQAGHGRQERRADCRGVCGAEIHPAGGRSLP